MQTPHAPVDGHHVSEKAVETADASSLYHVANPSHAKKEPSHYQEFPHYTLRDLGFPEQITISAGVEVCLFLQRLSLVFLFFARNKRAAALLLCSVIKKVLFDLVARSASTLSVAAMTMLVLSVLVWDC